MHRITNDEVDFILNDIESRGIVLEDLRDNLLDHLCCIIEDEMNEGENFKRFYESVLPRFFKEKLGEIQTETDNLLRFKNFYSMKKILKISGIATALFIVTGAVLKSFHLPGAGLAFLLGGGLFSLVFLPLIIAIKFKDEDSKVDKAVFTIGFLLAIVLSVGLIAKVMHWPNAGNIMRWTTAVFTIIYVPLYFFTRVKRPELRFNSSVNSVLMLACGGIFYTLFNVNYSENFSESMKEENIYIHENSEKLFGSNDRLYISMTQNDAAIKLHNSTVEINEKLETIAASIVKQNSLNEAKMLQELKKEITEYNDELNEFEVNELRQLDSEGIEHFERLTLPLALNALARLQQNLLVNENCYLSTVTIASE